VESAKLHPCQRKGLSGSYGKKEFMSEIESLVFIQIKYLYRSFRTDIVSGFMA
jgi:hypothetical protein